MLKFKFNPEAPAFGFLHEKSNVTITDAFFDEGFSDTVFPMEYYGLPEEKARMLCLVNGCLEETFKSELATADALRMVETLGAESTEFGSKWRADVVLDKFAGLWALDGSKAAAQYAVLLALTHPDHVINVLCPEGTLPDSPTKLFESVWSALVTYVAKEFSKVLFDWLGPVVLADVIRKNQEDEDKVVCHSHDFCDANEAMATVFERHGWPVNGQEHEAFVYKLWSASWNLAKASDFFQTEAKSGTTTRADVEKLKQVWLNDPCWELESAEGFEAYREELLEFQAKQREKWHAEHEQKQQAQIKQMYKKAEELGIPGNLALVQYLMKLEKRVFELESKYEAKPN